MCSKNISLLKEREREKWKDWRSVTCNYHLVWAESSNSFQKNTNHEKGMCSRRQKEVWAPVHRGPILELLWPLGSFPRRVRRHLSPSSPGLPPALHGGSENVATALELSLEPCEGPYLQARREYPSSFLGGPRGTTEPRNGRDSSRPSNTYCLLF